MKLNLSKLDRILLILATIGGLTFSYLLYDDSIFIDGMNDKNLSVIGNIANYGDDVRRKFASNFIWLNINKIQVVYQGDTIYTGDTSRAAITFNDSSHLYIEPNSLILLKMVNNKLTLDLKFGDIQQEVSAQSHVEIFSDGEKIELKGKKSTNVKQDKSIKIKKSFGKKVEIAKVTGEIEIKKFTKVIKPIQTPKPSENPKSNPIITSTPEIEPPIEEEVYKEVTDEMSSSETPALADKITTPPTVEPTIEKPQPVVPQNEVPPISVQPTVEPPTAEVPTVETPALKPLVVETPAVKPIKVETPSEALPIAKNQNIETPVIDETNWTKAIKFDRDENDQLPIEPEVKITGTTPKAIDHIRIQISKNALFNSILVDEKITELSYKFKPKESAKYFVRALANTSSQKESSWSKIATFTVVIEDSDSQLVAPVLARTKVSYDPTIHLKLKAPVIQWTKLPGASAYLLQISQKRTFDKIEFSKSIKDTALNWNEYTPGNFYFRVAGISKKGRNGPYSVGELKVTISAPKLSPLKDILAIGTSWDDKGKVERAPASWTKNPVAIDYRIEVAQEPTFKTKQTFNTKLSEYEIPLAEPGDFYVRVAPLNKDGIPIADFSNTEKINYTLKNPVKTPDLKEPFNNTTIFLQSDEEPFIWIDWNSVPQALKYEVEVSESEKFSKVFVKGSVEKNRFLIKGKIPMGQIFWRVRAQNDMGYSHWSKPNSFTLLTGKPGEEKK